MASPELEDLLALLEDQNAKKRREACRRLASLGDPEAIPELARVYREDEDNAVRDEAQKALVRFRAMEAAATGKATGRPLNTTLLSRLRLGLAGSLVILLLLNVMLRVLGGGDDEENGERPTDRQVLIEQITSSLNEMSADALALQEEWSKIGQPGGRLNCERRFYRPQPFDLREIDGFTYPDINTMIGPGSRYSFNIDLLALVFSSWDSACRENDPVSVGIEDANRNNSRVQRIIDSLPDLQSTLQILTNNPVPTRNPSDFGEGGEATPAQGVPPDTTAAPPTQTPAPTASPTALPNVDYATHIGMLETRMATTESTITDLMARWQTALQGALPSGCPGIVVEAPYTLPPDQQGDPLLDEAIRQVNQGLGETQQTFNLYDGNCPRGLTGVAQQGIDLLNAAQSRFDQARLLIEDMKVRSQLP